MIAVIGDFMIDHYLWGKSDRISPEAPVPVVEIVKEEERLGGAGNVVNNIRALNKEALPITVIGKDSKRVTSLLKKIDVDCSGVFIDSNKETIVKSRVISANHQMIRFDKED